jgi:uncharacterized protein (TIGR03089 family)
VLLPSDVLKKITASDPGRPRLTWYDDEPGATQGERIELSARVLTNWVNKAANLLQDDAAAGPGTTVGIDLPTHWRALYWALAVWSVGAEVVLGDEALEADVLVTTDPERSAAHRGDAILVCLPALARSHPDADRAGGAVDEARELSTHGDQFSPMAEPEVGDAGLSVGGADTAYGDLVAWQEDWGQSPRIATDAPLATALLQCLSAWAADGSVVLMRGPRADLTDRLQTEGVTHDLRGSQRTT